MGGNLRKNFMKRLPQIKSEVQNTIVPEIRKNLRREKEAAPIKKALVEASVEADEVEEASEVKNSLAEAKEAEEADKASEEAQAEKEEIAARKSEKAMIRVRAEQLQDELKEESRGSSIKDSIRKAIEKREEIEEESPRSIIRRNLR